MYRYMQCLIDIQIFARYSPILLVGLLCFWLHQGDNSHHFLHVPHYLSLFKISFFLKNWTFTCTLSSPRAHNCLSIGGDVPQMLDNIPARRWFSAADCPQLQQRAAASNHSRSIWEAGGGRRENLHLLLHWS